MSRRVVLAALVVASLGQAVPARADDVAEAKAHFRKGAELYRASRWREAIAEFEAAYRLKPHGAIHFNVAQCRERLGEWPAALRSYLDYLREVPDAKDRAAVRAAVQRLEQRLAAAAVQALLVYSDPPGAEVRIDGRPRGKTPFHIVLPPGTYELRLALDGHEPLAAEVELAAEASRTLDVVLRARPPAVAAAPSPPPPAPDLTAPPPADASPSLAAPVAPPRERRRVYTWVAAGAAVVAASAGAYYGLAAREDADAIDGIANDGARARRVARDAESKARRANVLYAVSGAAAAAGVTLFFVEKRF